MLNKQPKRVDVGWWDDKYPDGTPVAWVAMLNEYGYMTSGKYQGYHPPRPFFRIFFKEFISNSAVLKQDILPLVKQVADGKVTWAAIQKRIGMLCVEWVKSQIIKTNSPPNTPLTISLKGFNDPLIETGRMYDTVKYKIRHKPLGFD